MENKEDHFGITRFSKPLSAEFASDSASRWTPWLVNWHEGGISLGETPDLGRREFGASGSCASARGVAEEERRRVGARRGS